MNSKKKKTSIGNIITTIMLKIMLKMMKKGTIPKKYAPPPSFLIFPKTPEPQSDLFLERKRVVYKCGKCKHKFVLKSDINLDQKIVAQWMSEVRSHKCHVD